MITGFFDIHSHILPYADDGAQNMAEAMAMLRFAWNEGTRQLMLTPHYRPGCQNSVSWLQETFSLLQQMAAQELPELQLYLGTEICWSSDIPQALLQGDLLTLNRSSYLLVEFPGQPYPAWITGAVAQLRQMGYIPILAHVERYDCFYSNAALASALRAQGARIQLNADSVLGLWGREPKALCRRLIRQGAVDFIASDAHSNLDRPPALQACWKQVRRRFGEETARQLFWGNAQIIFH